MSALFPAIGREKDLSCARCVSRSARGALDAKRAVFECLTSSFGLRRDSAAERRVERNRMLTPREQQMVSLLVEGHSNGEIAKRLRLKRQTVKNQLATIYQKVGVTNRVQLAVLAVRHNLI